MSQPPSQPTGALYEIRYGEICPWLILVRSLYAALFVRVLLLAFVGVVITQWGWAALDGLFSSNPAQLERLTERQSDVAEVGPTLVDPGADSPTTSAQRVSAIGKFAQSPWAGPLVRGWAWLSEPFVRMAARDVSWIQCLSLSLSGIWAVVVWGVFGGAISRIAALYLTRGEVLGPIAALRAAIGKWNAISGGPLISLLFAAAFATPLVMIGLLLRLNLMALLLGLVWIAALVWGLILAIGLLGLLLGWPLMWATVGVERTDAFDGVSRCFAYVYQRPFHLVFYLLVATVLGLFGEAVVYYFAAAGVTLTEWTVSWGAGNLRAAELMGAPAADAAGKMIGFWQATLMAVAASFPLGYLWCASVGIYLLLRRHIDSTEMDEVALDQDEPQQGLPKLTPDESGIPQVDRETKTPESNDNDSSA
ncbi:MAG: hypothetical protein IH898_09775 [Planctomycetes bacterium]|nr:hypothetical protein [Planctomycetota bacterium]